MRFSACLAVALGIAQTGLCQQGGDLATAIAPYPELSTFAKLLSQLPTVITSVIPSSSTGVTILIPNNDAFSKYTNSTGLSITSLTVTQLQYHIMAANVTSADLNSANGIMVPTLLTDEQYNNRSAGADLVNSFGAEAAKGQLLYASKDPINPVKFRVRQASGKVNLRGGMAQGASLDPVDGTWSQGYFQIIDTILIPPAPCSNTIRGQGTLKSLDNALNRTDLYPVLDHTPNVTCLAPTNGAFNDAGDPDSTLNTTLLTGALLFHTLPFPLYSTYIPAEGLVVESVAGLNVTVTRQGGDIYFNDAKVISENVITNNGLIHVLNKVMSPNGTAPAATSTASSTSTPTSSSTSSPSASTTTTSQNAGRRLTGDAVGALVGFLAAVAVVM